jgi:hypothetical protein
MKVPRLQILTAAQILDNRRPQVPFGFTEGFKKAGREETSQDRCFDDLIGMGREAVAVTAAIRNCSRCRCLSLSLQRLATVCIKHSRPMSPPSRNCLVDYINRKYIGQTRIFLKSPTVPFRRDTASTLLRDFRSRPADNAPGPCA